MWVHNNAAAVAVIWQNAVKFHVTRIPGSSDNAFLVTIVKYQQIIMGFVLRVLSFRVSETDGLVFRTKEVSGRRRMFERPKDLRVSTKERRMERCQILFGLRFLEGVQSVILYNQSFVLIIIGTYIDRQL